MKRINLIPDEAKKITSSKWLKIHIFKSRILYGITLLCIGLIIINAWQISSIVRYRFSAKQVRNHIEKIRSSLMEKQNAYAKIKAEGENIARQTKITQARLKMLESIQGEWIHWVKFLTQMSTAVPEDLWINKVILNKDVITIAGTTLDNAVVSRFMANLDKTAYFKDTNFNYTQKAKNSDTSLVDFEVTTHIAPEKVVTGAF